MSAVRRTCRASRKEIPVLLTMSERPSFWPENYWPGLTAKAGPKSLACRTRSDGYPLPIHQQSAHRREAVLRTCEGESAKAANRHTWRSCRPCTSAPADAARSIGRVVAMYTAASPGSFPRHPKPTIFGSASRACTCVSNLFSGADVGRKQYNVKYCKNDA